MLDPTTAETAFNLGPWADLGSIGAMIGIVVWGVTKGIPGITQRFAEELRQQRDDFRVEIQESRAQAFKLATEGHKAVADLAAANQNLSRDFQELIRMISDKDAA